MSEIHNGLTEADMNFKAQETGADDESMEAKQESGGILDFLRRKIPGANLVITLAGIAAMMNGELAEASGNAEAIKGTLDRKCRLSICQKSRHGIVEEQPGHLVAMRGGDVGSAIGGNIYYQTGEFNGRYKNKDLQKLRTEIEEKFDKDLAKACGNQQRAKTIGEQLDAWEKKKWSDGDDKIANVVVSRPGKDGKSEFVGMAAQLATFEDVCREMERETTQISYNIANMDHKTLTAVANLVVDHMTETELIAIASNMDIVEKNQ